MKSPVSLTFVSLGAFALSVSACGDDTTKDASQAATTVSSPGANSSAGGPSSTAPGAGSSTATPNPSGVSSTADTSGQAATSEPVATASATPDPTTSGDGSSDGPGDPAPEMDGAGGSMAAGAGGSPTEPMGMGGDMGAGGDGPGGADEPAAGGAGGAGETPEEGMPSGGDATPSAGCGMDTGQQTGSWVESQVMTDGGNRPYSVWLPDGYDPMRAYPVIGLLHGCGSGTNNLPMERQTGSDAILFRGTGSAADTCWDSGANGADVAFVDAMIADVQARFCTDTSRFFAVGYSSGSWLADQLACIRADVLRGIATVAGGNPGVRNCTGPIAQIFVHDTMDNSNGINGSESARDRVLMENNCDTSIEPVPEDPSPCVRYQGCDPGYPVVWCATTGEGHNRQDNLAAPAFWNFFQEF